MDDRVLGGKTDGWIFPPFIWMITFLSLMLNWELVPYNIYKYFSSGTNIILSYILYICMYNIKSNRLSWSTPCMNRLCCPPSRFSVAGWVLKIFLFHLKGLIIRYCPSINSRVDKISHNLAPEHLVNVIIYPLCFVVLLKWCCLCENLYF